MKYIISLFVVASIFFGCSSDSQLEDPLDIDTTQEIQEDTESTTTEMEDTEESNETTEEEEEEEMTEEDTETEEMEEEDSESEETEEMEEEDSESEETEEMEEEMEEEDTESEEMEAVPELLGTFVSAAHPTEGQVVINAERTELTITGFKSDNGPMLELYIATDLEATEYVTLGGLQGLEGDFTYAIPEDVDFETHKHITVWCVPFAIDFGHALLE